RADDIRLELRNNELRIHGEHREKDRVGVLRRQTRRIGEFEHVVSLPGEVDPNRGDATLHDGRLPSHPGKTATARPPRIEIKSTGPAGAPAAADAPVEHRWPGPGHAASGHCGTPTDGSWLRMSWTGLTLWAAADRPGHLLHRQTRTLIPGPWCTEIPR